jgi:hypothetical protein
LIFWSRHVVVSCIGAATSTTLDDVSDVKNVVTPLPLAWQYCSVRLPRVAWKDKIFKKNRNSLIRRRMKMKFIWKL